MPEMTYLEAAKTALAEEMRRDPAVWALGEDLGRGGVFGQYAGLAAEFGAERIVGWNKFWTIAILQSRD